MFDDGEEKEEGEGDFGDGTDNIRAALEDDEEAKRGKMNCCTLCWYSLPCTMLSLDDTLTLLFLRSYDFKQKVKLQAQRRRDPMPLFHWSIKEIDGRFGSSIVSWFLFARWAVVWNFVLFLLFLSFLVVRFSVFLQLPNRY